MWIDIPWALSPQPQRRLVASLRRMAARGAGPGGAASRWQVVLVDRAAAVRDDLLEVADLLERAADPDPAAVEMLRGLLSDGCESGLYNRDVHLSEVRACLYYARERLIDRATPAPARPAGDARIRVERPAL
jgi:hypothetical protein